MNEPLRIGIAGLGTVGASVARILKSKSNSLTHRCGRPIEVTGVTARDRTKDRGVDLAGIEWFETPEALAASSDIDVFVELVGGDSGAALDSIRTALRSGHHVVTANKALLAKHGVELALLAEEKGLILNYEAAVAGGIPVIKTMRESLAANDVSRVYGILNGTANYILTRMERDEISFEDCLADAQRLGYAEADPTFDVEGFDTAHKLAILTSIAFGTRVAADEIYVEGISNITLADIHAARELGYRIKLLGVALRTATGIEQRVHPTMVPLGSMIGQVDSVTNAVGIEADTVGSLLLSGPGAGGDATASAVIGDVADIAKSLPGHQEAPVFGRPAKELEPYQQAEIAAHAGGYFIRLTVHDRIGVFASLAGHMARNDISLASIVQHGGVKGGEDTQKTVVLVTHETTEADIRTALEAVLADGHLVSKPQVIRIEPAG